MSPAQAPSPGTARTLPFLPRRGLPGMEPSPPVPGAMLVILKAGRHSPCLALLIESTLVAGLENPLHLSVLRKKIHVCLVEHCCLKKYVLSCVRSYRDAENHLVVRVFTECLD